MAVKSVHDLGGSARLLDILESGPVRGLRNWPAAVALVRAGFASERHELEVCDPGEERYYVYTITDRGRRKLRGYRGRFA